MEKWYNTLGVLNYSSSGWLVVNVSQGIQKYYHYWLQKELGVKLNQPKFGCHITVVAGKYEQVQTHKNWNKYQKENIALRYNSFPLEQDGVFWLVCKCPTLSYIRRELGLGDLPKWPFHITIANKKNL